MSSGGRGTGWFVVLSDCVAGAAVAAAFHKADHRIVRHASGRPWLIGQWGDEELMVASAGSARVAVVGDCSATPSQLRHAAEGLRALTDLDTVGHRWAGSFHLLASAAGRVRVQGTASGLRRVFSARVGEAVVAADRSDVLARVLGADVDEEILALRLIVYEIPHPLDQRSVWRGVEAVAPGHWLELRDDRTARQRRWWSPPEPELSVTEGAPGLARALVDAVDLRTRGGGTISADLSGGMDSTPLCFLADRGPAHLMAVTRMGIDASQDDAGWARRAAQYLGNTTHRLLVPESVPAWYTDLPRSGEGMDEPTAGARIWAQLRDLARDMTAAGSRLHLSGEGGDQVLEAARGYLHDTMRSHPMVGWAHLRATAARLRWRRTDTARAVLDRRSFSDWLTKTAADLAPYNPLHIGPDLGWQSRPALPVWATPDAKATVRALLAKAATTAEPLAPTRGQHGTLTRIYATTPTCRNLTRVGAEAGLPIHYPYLDDRVLEACLAVRPHERSNPLAYKPLMTAAMRGIVPDEVLGRRTKGHFMAEMHAGLLGNRTDFAELLDSSHLAHLGLVDPDALRHEALGPYTARTYLLSVENALALEAWLRTALESPSASDHHPKERTCR